MRILVHLTPNTRPVPFEYPQRLLGRIHKWLGENDYHDEISLYSFSWLQGSRKKGDFLDFKYGAKWFISSYDMPFVQELVRGVFQNSHLEYGMEIKDIVLTETPQFGQKEQFWLGSPVFLKRNETDETGKEFQKYYTYKDKNTNELLTQTLQTKLQKAGIDDPTLKVYFDTTYEKPKTKMMRIKNKNYRASMCPVIIEGKSESLAFAWNVGVGNNTGMGFGSLV